MKKDAFLSGKTASEIYGAVKDLPIIDYHCHLSPKEIFEDNIFENIGEMWLGADHYKWRLMRTYGIDEEFITGNASYKDKFIKYAEAISMSPGNPLYHWSHMELMQFFGINDSLDAESAEAIWEKANKYIKDNKLSPRKLIKSSGVEVICTTDDIIDDLSWHKKISEDKSLDVRVIPSFRTDNLLLIKRNGYKEYIEKLSACSNTEITDLNTLKYAIELRLDFFAENGCRFTDVGIPYFPSEIYDDGLADTVFKKALSGEKITEEEYDGFLGNMYLFLAKEYKEHDLYMQLHLSVIRNSNEAMFNKLGPDSGFDTVGDAVSGTMLSKILSEMNLNDGLPKTVIYTLNETNASQIASICAAFKGVIPGAAWWFCDHKNGIEKEIDVIAENGSLGSFLGMLTDSRSFLSYARHDYFRRILASKLASYVDAGEYDKKQMIKVAGKICYYNIKETVGE